MEQEEWRDRTWGVPTLFGLFLVLAALAVMEVGMKMQNTSILWTVKITIHVIVSAMSVNHHRVLYLTLTLSKLKVAF